VVRVFTANIPRSAIEELVALIIGFTGVMRSGAGLSSLRVDLMLRASGVV